jgi:amino acid transporter
MADPTGHQDARDPLLDRSRSPISHSSASSTAYKATDISRSSFDLEPPSEHEGTIENSVEADILPETAVLGRNLGWSSAYILIMSRVIGSGIFATPGVIVQSVGSIGITLILWIAGAIISWFGLMVTLEYGCMLPRSGGDKVYLEFTYRRPRFLASVLIAVQSVLLGFTASNCIVFAEYVLFASGREFSRAEMKLLAAGLLTAIVLTHSCFLRTGIFIQNVLGWVQIGLCIFMFFAGLFAVFFHVGLDERPVRLPLWEGSVWNWGIISTALFKVFYSYAGLHNVNNVLNEVKDPVRTLRSAASVALLTCCILYVLVNMGYFLVVPIEEIKTSGELIAGLFFHRLFGQRVGSVMLPLVVAISAAGNVMVVTFSHERISPNPSGAVHSADH